MFVISVKSILNEFKYNNFSNFQEIEYGDKNYGIIIRLKNEKIDRGCIGFIKNLKTFEEACRVASINAAFFDNRYKNITRKEFINLEIDITILGIWEKIETPISWDPQKNSLMVKYLNHRSILQGQIMDEYNLNKKSFLKILMRKANLALNSWKNPKYNYYKAYSIHKTLKVKKIINKYIPKNNW